MVLVLCDPFDTAALWAAAQLRDRAVPVQLVTSDELDGAIRCSHRVGRTGTATIDITLADGRTLTGAAPQGVLNRLGIAPTGRLDRLGGPDRDYAVQEMQALYLSWLHALPGPMLNRPTPQGLGGVWRHPADWAMMAGQAGLAVAPYRHETNAEWSVSPTSASTVFVMANQVIAPPNLLASTGLPARVRAGCIRLAALSGEALLGITFTRTPRWQVQDASPRPDLTAGGAALIDALQAALTP